MKKFLIFISIFFVAGLSACGLGAEPPFIPSQRWQEMEVRIETQPNPPIGGMTEIVVIITGPRGKPIYDLIVSLRGRESTPWVQTIQDGHIGVYRRAVDIGGGENAVLQVRLQRGELQNILLFPIRIASG